MDRLPKAIADRLMPLPWTGCWVWLGPFNRNGYGRAWFEGAREMVHRLVYRLLVGPIPDGLVLDHLCRERCCANPAHMEPVTVRENTLRGEARLFGRTTL